MPLSLNTLAAEKIAEAPFRLVEFDSETKAALEHVVGRGDVVAIVPIGLFHAAAIQCMRTAKPETNGGPACHERVEYVPRHIDRQQIEFSMTALVRFSRQLTRRDLAPSRVSFTHRRNEDASELSAFFACDVAFGAAADQAIFDAAFRDLPVVTADPHLYELLTAYGDEALAQPELYRGALLPRGELLSRCATASGRCI